MKPRPTRGPSRPAASLSRRGLLRAFALGGAWAGVGFPDAHAESPTLPSDALRQSDPDRYWGRIRSEQFLLAEDRIFLNPGSLGLVPRPTLEAVVKSLTRNCEFPTDDVPRWGYETLEAERAEMSEFLGCRKEELAFTHNCTAAMSTIANGLDLAPGDEVLTTHQEHGGGSACWHLRAARQGIVRREVEIPLTPKEPGELLDRLITAIGPRTRVLSFSGITSPTGLILPVREICAAARAKGIITVVDGAHMDGQVPVNLHELGCDYFAGSPHKWMFAPPGSGLLYGRDDLLDRLWPCVVSSGWDNKSGLHAARFMMIGTNNRSTVDGMIAGLRFLKRLGAPAVYDRMHHLARTFRQEAQRRSYLEIVTPNDSRFYQAMVTIRFKTDRLEALSKAWKESRMYLLGGQQMRLSFHIYARPSDIAKFFEISDRLLG